MLSFHSLYCSVLTFLLLNDNGVSSFVIDSKSFLLSRQRVSIQSSIADENEATIAVTAQSPEPQQQKAANLLYRQEQQRQQAIQNAKEETTDYNAQLNAFLDTPFFDPTKVPEDSPFRWFVDLVENDYVAAEAIYEGIIFLVGTWGGVEMLRAEWHSGHFYGDGRLF